MEQTKNNGYLEEPKDNETIFTPDISGDEFIDNIFQMTDSETGIVYIPGWYYFNEKPHSLRCKFNHFGYRECEKTKSEYRKLVDGIKKIAGFLKEHPDRESITQSEIDEFAYRVWSTYVRPFEADENYTDEMCDIEDRLDTMNVIKDISRRIVNDEAVSEEDLRFLKEYADVVVTDPEKQMVRKYMESIRSEAEKRVGNGGCDALHLVITAMRLCKLYQIGAPAILIENEEHRLAAVLVIHRYGENTTPVDDAVRLKREEYMNSDDDTDYDETCTGYTTNTRKSMLPLFLYMIITEQSDAEHRLRQKDILEKLSESPYEIAMERKAIGRMIHNLAEADLGIHVDKTGVWFEKIDI